MNKYSHVEEFKNNTGTYPFFDKIESGDEGLLVKEINVMMQKGWIPISGIKKEDNFAPGMMPTVQYYVFMMRSPSVSLPSTPIKDFIGDNNESSNSTNK
jgi:hypothetical protein